MYIFINQTCSKVRKDTIRYCISSCCSAMISARIAPSWRLVVSWLATTYHTGTTTSLSLFQDTQGNNNICSFHAQSGLFTRPCPHCHSKCECESVCMVKRPTRHIIGHFGDDLYRPDDQTNSVKSLKETSWSSRSGLNPIRSPEPLHHVTIIQL